MTHSPPTISYLRLSLYCLVGTASVLLFLKNAWLAEDCYILLRSVDQFLAGNGFRWNPHERVQVFTSPLWFLLIVMGASLSSQLYVVAIGLSLLLHVALLAIMARLLPSCGRWVSAVLLLSFSQAFFDFTASGLEYPLIYLLIASFVLLYLRNRHVEDRPWLLLCAGLALITRHDLLCVLLPMLIHLTWHYRQTLPLRQQMLSMVWLLMPLAIWTLFSLVYYGVPFPNTAYAKLGVPGLPLTDRLTRGLIYTIGSLKVDPVTPVLIALAMLKGYWSGNTRLRVLAASLTVGYTYITFIGGDYMLGRFFAPLYLVAVLLLTSARWQSPWISRPAGVVLGLISAYLLALFVAAEIEPLNTFFTLLQLPTIESSRTGIAVCASIGLLLVILAVLPALRLRLITASVFCLLLFYSTQQHDSPWQTPYSNWGKTADNDLWWMIDTLSRERYWIYRWTSLHTWLNRDPAVTFPDHPWCREGKVLPNASIVRFSGMMPYCLGTEKIAVDSMGLTDPLVARMPRHPNATWLAGGVNRVIPPGYLESLTTGQNHIQDPDIARYHDIIGIITRSPELFTWARIKTIVAFNLGAYDHLLDKHREFAAQLKKADTPP